MTQGTSIPTEVDADEHIEYGHVFANYVKSVADTPADPDPYPDIAVVNGQVSVTATFPGSAARGSLRLPGSPRSYGLIVTGDTFEIVNSKLVDHEGREGIWLVAAVDDVPLSWQAVVTLQDSAGRTIYNKSYIIHYDLWLETEDGLEIDLPDLIPTPSRLEPPEGAAIRLAERAVEEIKFLKGLIEISQTDAAESASFALTSRNQAQGFRNEAEGFRDDAHTSAGEAGDSATDALTSRNQAQGFRNEAEGFRDDARTSAGEAGDSADAAAASQSAAKTSETNAAASQGAAKTSETNAKTSETNAGTSEDEAAEHARRAGVERNFAEQASTNAFGYAVQMEQYVDQHNAYLNQWWTDFSQSLEADFNEEMAKLTSLRGEMSNIAVDVAVDANRAEDAAQATEDALTVVRAHRWVPQGEWESDLAYSAGDVVAHDDGSYYAQTDIPAGVEPPGGDWMMLGSGGITDAAELTGALTEYVDASGVSVRLGDYFPGLSPELQVVQLAAILGILYQSMDSSVEASRITGALTDQVDVTDATVHFLDPDTLDPVGDPYPVSFAIFAALMTAQQANDALSGKADTNHTHPVAEVDGLQAALDETTDASRLEGALTDQVDAGAAMVQPLDPYTSGPVGEPLPQGVLAGLALSGMQQAIDGLASKADVGHTHTANDITGALTDQVDVSGAVVVIEGFALPLATVLAVWDGRILDLESSAERADVAPATWHWSGTSLPTTAAQVNFYARVGDFIVAPNLDTDPGWHQITGV